MLHLIDRRFFQKKPFGIASFKSTLMHTLPLAGNSFVSLAYRSLPAESGDAFKDVLASAR